MFHAKTHRASKTGNATWVSPQGGAAPHPVLGSLDFLGRMPIPLRRPFNAGLERVAAAHGLACSFVMGGGWYAPFDELSAAATPDELPDMVVTPWSADDATARLLGLYAARPAEAKECHVACREAGLPDPLGVFSVFAVIPLVFLVDHVKLAGRRPPRCWGDLLAPEWRGEVVFGGWRPNERMPFTDYNEFLLLSLFEEFGADGLSAFAANVKGLQHNVVSSRTAGAEHAPGGTVTILPWMQAEMSPRRGKVSVVWPEDGAYAMPIGFLAKPERRERLRPLVEYLTGPDLGRVLARNCYPPVHGPAGGFPPGARLKWLGWDHVRRHDVAARAAQAGRLFFEAWPG
jgi:ABC-type Fe3+ transport system, periplasmic component